MKQKSGVENSELNLCIYEGVATFGVHMLYYRHMEDSKDFQSSCYCIEVQDRCDEEIYLVGYCFSGSKL